MAIVVAGGYVPVMNVATTEGAANIGFATRSAVDMIQLVVVLSYGRVIVWIAFQNFPNVVRGYDFVTENVHLKHHDL